MAHFSAPQFYYGLKERSMAKFNKMTALSFAIIAAVSYPNPSPNPNLTLTPTLTLTLTHAGGDSSHACIGHWSETFVKSIPW